MMKEFNPNRYAIISEKNPREIVMLRGKGCRWRRCRFCDYHLDCSTDEKANFALNQEQLQKVTGIYKKLEVINSGSFVDLDESTLERIAQICLEKEIRQVHFECHWQHRGKIRDFRKRFAALDIELKIKTGVETFNKLFRESYLDKGIDAEDPAELAEYFDEVCLLQGIPGQSAQSMEQDIETGLSFFERVCVNIMQENLKPIKPDPAVIAIFTERLYPKYCDNQRVDILMENTAFGVGGVVEHAE
ncbi:radical SAM protein [Lachnospiraceae bacterium]|nr:radical SAM protein [Lachnospiraceae bacterium]